MHIQMPIHFEKNFFSPKSQPRRLPAMYSNCQHVYSCYKCMSSMVNAIAGSLVIKVSDKGSPETPRSAEGECALVHRKMGKNAFWKNSTAWTPSPKSLTHPPHLLLDLNRKVSRSILSKALDILGSQKEILQDTKNLGEVKNTSGTSLLQEEMRLSVYLWILYY